MIPKKQSNEYLLSAYLKQPVPLSGSQEERAILEEAELGRNSYSLSDKFVRHFYACVIDVLKRVELLKSRKGKEAASSSGN